MPKYVVAHGSLRTGRDDSAGVGETVELEEAFVKEVDPEGTSFVTEERWLAMEELRELNLRIALMSDEDKLSALRAATTATAPKEEKKSRHRRNEEGA